MRKRRTRLMREKEEHDGRREIEATRSRSGRQPGTSSRRQQGDRGGSKEFLSVVAKSRGAIQKCYEQALKKNTACRPRR